MPSEQHEVFLIEPFPAFSGILFLQKSLAVMSIQTEPRPVCGLQTPLRYTN